MTARCTNVLCSSPVRWDGRTGAWLHKDTGEISCRVPDPLGLVEFVKYMPPLAQQKTHLPDQLFWRCPTCRSWVPVRQLQGDDALYARCYGPASARHEPTRWVSAEGLEPPSEPVDDTTPPMPEPRAADITWEYGIEYHYSPGRWHVLPNLVIPDLATAQRELTRRQLAVGSGGAHAYRLLKRRAAGAWVHVGA